MKKPLRVYITIDTECREERLNQDKIIPAAGYDKRIFGDFENAKGLGVTFIVETFLTYKIKGVFFVDPFGSYSFGKEGLLNTIQYLNRSNQDIQLHIHPVQKYAFWHSSNQTPPSDFLSDYSLEAQTQLIAEGKNILYENGVHDDSINTMRAGHYSANNISYEAMARNGINYSTNYNIDYIHKNICKLNRRSENHNGVMRNNTGVIEFPITNVSTPTGLRHCQITALSFSEIKSALSQAYEKELGDFVIVTHSFEFLFESSRGTGYKNYINRQRLKKLCRYLSSNPERYQVSVFGDVAVPENKNKGTIPVISPTLYILRLFLQGVKATHLKIINKFGIIYESISST